MNSPLGLSLRGIREGGKRMPAIGAPVARRLRTIFTVGAAIAGVAGALLAQTTQFVGIDTLGFPRSAELLRDAGSGRRRTTVRRLGQAPRSSCSRRTISPDFSPVYWQLGIGTPADRGGAVRTRRRTRRASRRCASTSHEASDDRRAVHPRLCRRRGARSRRTARSRSRSRPAHATR